MYEESGEAPAGLFAALKRIVATLLASGRTRLELLGNEIEEEKQRAVHLLVMAQGMVICLAIGMVFTVFFLTAVFWEYRAFVLGMAAALFLVFGAVFYAAFNRATQRRERMFAASIAEFEEDLRHLRTATGHEPQGE